MGSNPMYKTNSFFHLYESFFITFYKGKQGGFNKINMKLAEALILRSDYQKKVQQLRQRLMNVAKIQEGETPAQEPQVLIVELEETINNLTSLIQNINLTNSSSKLEDNLTIADALAQRDMLSLQRGVYQSLLDTASQPYNRYSRSEIKYFTTINIVEIQKKVDDISKQYRELDTLIQSANWNTELVNNMSS